MKTPRTFRWTHAASLLLLVLLAVIACIPGIVVRWKIVETVDTFDRSVSHVPALRGSPVGAARVTGS